MKTTITLIATVYILVTAHQTAVAKESGGARFNFAPNMWQETKVPTPRATSVVPSVKSGSVPNGASFLGLNPSLLSKPTPPPSLTPAVTQVAARPLIIQALPAPVCTQFKAAFGKPIDALPHQAAVHQKAPTSPIANRGHVRRVIASAHGTLKHALKANQTQSPLCDNTAGPVAGYGKNVGYIPGPYLPAQPAEGIRTQTDVHGQLIRRGGR